MPNAAIIGAALTTAAAHPYGLLLGGVDVLREPGQLGFGVMPNDVRITEVGPGGVSSLTATIDDPQKEIGIVAGSEVVMWDNVNNVCLFRGWVDNYGSSPDFGGQGRTVTFEATGVEALLDWFMVPNGFSFANGARISHSIGLLAQQYCPKLKAPSQASGMASAPYTRNGSFDYPIGSMARPSEPSLATIFTTTTTTGGTMRQAIGQLLELSQWLDVSSGNFSSQPVEAFVTVDFYYGLRVWEDDPSLQPDDYTTLTVTDTTAGSPNAANLQSSVDWSGVVRQVYVQGGNAAASGFFGDGSGINGKGAYISDASLTTVDQATQRAQGYMAQLQASVRGSFILDDFTPTSTVHAGSLVTITDAATGLSATHRIMQIDKTFKNSGRQTWNVTFGGLSGPSVTRLVRRMTRSSLN